MGGDFLAERWGRLRKSRDLRRALFYFEEKGPFCGKKEVIEERKKNEGFVR